MGARLGLLLLPALLAACAPLVASVRVPPVPDRVAAETGFTVRAFSADGAELVGAACEAASPLFAVRFRAPARLTVPDLGSASPPVAVTCRSGDLAATATTAAGIRLETHPFGHAAYRWEGPAYPVTHYRDLRLVLGPGAEVAARRRRD